MTATGIATRRPDFHRITHEGPELLPLNAGEQYRFSFAMDACIGCHSCEVACAEQNGNPLGVEWRKVGEVEGGTFPNTRRFSVSMACNHCLEPACLQGCPTNAYVKLANGVVEHHADDCVGCQYCIWQCPYDVPVFNPTRRIVTKCDMCQPRLAAGRAPACVAACPTHAIKVEKVDVGAWRTDHAAADAPGLPSSGITVSTTRIVVPDNLPLPATIGGHHRVEPEHPHLPLVALTLLSQTAVGAVWAVAFLATWAFAASGGSSLRTGLASGATVAFLAGMSALAASLLHLGRPAMAWKALRNLRTSWLSREVALLGAFVAATAAFAGCALTGLSTALPASAAAVLGAAGVYASARLYLIPARPMWNSPRTIVGFFASALTIGPMVVLITVGPAGIDAAAAKAVVVVATAGSALQLAVWRHLLRTAARHGAREFHASARLLWGRFRTVVVARTTLGILALATLLVAFAAHRSEISAVMVCAFAFVASGELLGRYLFYVTVVPMRGPGRLNGAAR